MFVKLKVPEEMTAFMVNIVLPSTDHDAVKKMQKSLDETYNIFLVFGSVLVETERTESLELSDTGASEGVSSLGKQCISASNNIYFIRLSAQIYLDRSDFMLLKDLVPQLLRLDS
jgi:uncharacterized membrane protein YgaE (UPF0421/DUF939 family)